MINLLVPIDKIKLGRLVFTGINYKYITTKNQI